MYETARRQGRSNRKFEIQKFEAYKSELQERSSLGMGDEELVPLIRRESGLEMPLQREMFRVRVRRYLRSSSTMTVYIYQSFGFVANICQRNWTSRLQRANNKALTTLALVSSVHKGRFFSIDVVFLYSFHTYVKCVLVQRVQNGLSKLAW